MMSEQLGLLKVIVVQGKRLVIRDFKTSDPYVVLKLGNQVNRIDMSHFSLFLLTLNYAAYLTPKCYHTIPDCKDQGN